MFECWSSDPHRQYAWQQTFGALIPVLVITVLMEFQTSDPYNPIYVMDSKNITDAQMTQDFLPYSTYTYLPVLIVLGSLTSTVGYVPWIFLGILGRNANTIVLIWMPPSETWAGGLSEVFYTFYHMGSAVMYSYIYFLVEFDNKEQYLTAQAAVQLTAVVSRVLSALVADLLVNFAPNGLAWTMYVDLGITIWAIPYAMFYLKFPSALHRERIARKRARVQQLVNEGSITVERAKEIKEILDRAAEETAWRIRSSSGLSAPLSSSSPSSLPTQPPGNKVVQPQRRNVSQSSGSHQSRTLSRYSRFSGEGTEGDGERTVSGNADAGSSDCDDDEPSSNGQRNVTCWDYLLCKHGACDLITTSLGIANTPGGDIDNNNDDGRSDAARTLRRAWTTTSRVVASCAMFYARMALTVYSAMLRPAFALLFVFYAFYSALERLGTRFEVLIYNNIIDKDQIQFQGSLYAIGYAFSALAALLVATRQFQAGKMLTPRTNRSAFTILGIASIPVLGMASFAWWDSVVAMRFVGYVIVQFGFEIIKIVYFSEAAHEMDGVRIRTFRRALRAEKARRRLEKKSRRKQREGRLHSARSRQVPATVDSCRGGGERRPSSIVRPGSNATLRTTGTANNSRTDISIRNRPTLFRETSTALSTFSAISSTTSLDSSSVFVTNVSATGNSNAGKNPQSSGQEKQNQRRRASRKESLASSITSVDGTSMQASTIRCILEDQDTKEKAAVAAAAQQGTGDGQSQLPTQTRGDCDRHGSSGGTSAFAVAAAATRGPGQGDVQRGISMSAGQGPQAGKYGDIFIANLILMNAIEVICQGVMISGLKMDAESYTKVMDIIFSCAYVASVLWLVGVIVSARLWARREFGPSMRAEIVTRKTQKQSKPDDGKGTGVGEAGDGTENFKDAVNDKNAFSKDTSTTQRVDVFEIDWFGDVLHSSSTIDVSRLGSGREQLMVGEDVEVPAVAVATSNERWLLSPITARETWTRKRDRQKKKKSEKRAQHQCKKHQQSPRHFGKGPEDVVLEMRAVPAKRGTSGGYNEDRELQDRYQQDALQHENEQRLVQFPLAGRGVACELDDIDREEQEMKERGMESSVWHLGLGLRPRANSKAQGENE